MSPETLMILAMVAPLVGAVVIGFTGRSPNLREGVTLATSAIVLFLVATLAISVLNGARPEYTLVELVPGIPLEFVLEPLGMIFALVAALLWPIASIYSIGYMRGNHEHSQTRFYVCFALAIASVMGVAFSGNLVTLFVFYEALTMSTYPLVTHQGDRRAMLGGRTYLSILISTSVGLLLLAIGWTYVATGTIEFAPGGIIAGHLSGWTVGLLLALFIYGIGKAAVMPVHRWLPAAMVAPTPVSALLHAVAVVKAGVFSVMKVLVYVFGLDLLRSEASTQWLLYVAGFTIIAGSVVALRIGMRGGNLKRLLAYSTISQLSYIVIAGAIFAPMAAVGGAMHIMAHAFGKITLFFAAGSIHTAAHKDDVSQLHGIGRKMPITMAAFGIGSLSMIGLPPTGGFVSKWFMLMGAFNAHQYVAVAVIVVSTLLNAAYFGPIVYMAFFRSPAEKLADARAEVHDHGHGHDHHHHDDHGEAPLPILIALCATASLTVLLFFFPDVPLALAEAMVGAVTAQP